MISGAGGSEMLTLAPERVERIMSLYFFDIYDDNGSQIDTVGAEFTGSEAIRREAQRLLPDIARNEISEDGDRRAFAVMVRNEARRNIYSATLTYTGFWLPIEDVTAQAANDQH